MSIYDKSLNEYLEVAASKSPTPGGGSVSAVVATNAAAMVCMVANLTLGKKGYEGVEAPVKEILEGTTQAIVDLKALTARDMQAFDIFMTAWRLPSETDEQKKTKAQEMEKAAQNASTVPLEICKICLEILKLAAKLAPIGNKGAISDVGVGAYVAEAALKAAMLSVDINLPSITDEGFRTRLVAERARLFAEAEELKLLALADVKKRL
ncbi:MAG: cyclodeaminase/cyclohydrolase family protein [Deltaproteobacteria bacterium]|nr:cyclodeaminase/cyclohydrolase family protein [Deltaproteobacteria bacterium]